MSTNSRSSSRSNTRSKSATYSQTFEDDVSETSNNREDYADESFEDDSQDEESDGGMSLSTLERINEKPRGFVNKTFTSTQIREIERENAILMNKILTYSRKPRKHAVNALPRCHVTSAAINRKKNQMKIDWENQILLKKIQSAKPAVKH